MSSLRIGSYWHTACALSGDGEEQTTLNCHFTATDATKAMGIALRAPRKDVASDSVDPKGNPSRTFVRFIRSTA